MMELYLGTCMSYIKKLDGCSVDAIITDPPYELGNFRGKVQEWESSGVALMPELWKEMYRVLKPGGYLLSFGANRTIHRFSSLIEEAGFEVRDMLIWEYNQSIPRTMNISKAIDGVILFGSSNTKYLKMVEQQYGGEAYEIKGTQNTMFGKKVTFQRREYSPVTDDAKKWDGWGTNLAPSYEPIVMARKKFDGSVAENVLQNGLGAINIDGMKQLLGEDRFPSNILKFQKDRRESFNNHPTVKPVKLMEYLVTMVTQDGNCVLDPFMGSGTTGIACINRNRKFIGIELSEEYFNIAIKRFSSL